LKNIIILIFVIKRIKEKESVYIFIRRNDL